MPTWFLLGEKQCVRSPEASVTPSKSPDRLRAGPLPDFCARDDGAMRVNDSDPHLEVWRIADQNCSYEELPHGHLLPGPSYLREVRRTHGSAARGQTFKDPSR
jgi:hypothetical protein